jgi:hypothetical protein
MLTIPRYLHHYSPIMDVYVNCFMDQRQAHLKPNVFLIPRYRPIQRF